SLTRAACAPSIVAHPGMLQVQSDVVLSSLGDGTSRIYICSHVEVLGGSLFADGNRNAAAHAHLGPRRMDHAVCRLHEECVRQIRHLLSSCGFHEGHLNLERVRRHFLRRLVLCPREWRKQRRHSGPLAKRAFLMHSSVSLAPMTTGQSKSNTISLHSARAAPL